MKISFSFHTHQPMMSCMVHIKIDDFLWMRYLCGCKNSRFFAIMISIFCIFSPHCLMLDFASTHLLSRDLIYIYIILCFTSGVLFYEHSLRSGFVFLSVHHLISAWYLAQSCWSQYMSQSCWYILVARSSGTVSLASYALDNPERRRR